MMKKLGLLIVSFIFIFSFSGCSCKDEEKIEKGSIYLPSVKGYYTKNINGASIPLEPFQAYITLEYFYKSEAQRAQEQFRNEFIRLHKLFDRHYYYFDDNNNLINNLRVINESNGEEIVVDQDLIDILKEGIRFTKLSKGKFNLGVGNLSSLWDGYIELANDMDDPVIDAPSQEMIDNALACTPSYNEIENIIVINDENNTVKINSLSGCSGQVTITLGALAKSYAAEKVAKFDSIKSGNFLINAGGSTIKVIGKNLNKENGVWKVGITDSYLVYKGLEKRLATYYVNINENMSISTSSGDLKHYVYENNYYHHIIDAISGYPNQNRLAVTALTSDSMYADIVTTAMMSMDMNESKEFLLSLKNEGIVVNVFIQDLIGDTSKVYISKDMMEISGKLEVEKYQDYINGVVIEEFSYDS